MMPNQLVQLATVATIGFGAVAGLLEVGALSRSQVRQSSGGAGWRIGLSLRRQPSGHCAARRDLACVTQRGRCARPRVAAAGRSHHTKPETVVSVAALRPQARDHLPSS
jgi:hypothetical protein